MDWKKACVLASDPIRQAMLVMTEQACQFVAVVDSELRLVGTVTDGDVRRHILVGRSIDAPCRMCMNDNFVAVDKSCDAELATATMRHHSIRYLPVYERGTAKLCGILSLSELEQQPPQRPPVLIMAGGKGKRLRPLTADTPKPMLRVGGKPMLETTVASLRAQGFSRMLISVRYCADQVEGHFGDGSAHGVEIEYIREGKELGTAGCLSLVPEQHKDQLVVVNGDVLTLLSMGSLLDFHGHVGADVTMCIRGHAMRLPYGVVEADGHRFVRVDEKPVHQYFANAGVYVLSRAVIDLVGHGDIVDMPDLINHASEIGRDVAVFPVHEYWSDVGRREDYEAANQQYAEVFG